MDVWTVDSINSSPPKTAERTKSQRIFQFHDAPNPARARPMTAMRKPLSPTIRTPGSPMRKDSPSAEDRTQTIKALIDAGHTDRLMVGHDWSVYLGTGGEATREIYAKHNPDRFLYITRRQLPRLRELGVAESDIHRITVDNPRRFFES